MGNRDNQISPGTVLPGSITIAKETNPNGDAQSFSFTCTSPLGSFSLTDGGSQAFPGLSAGSYTCTETVPSGWASPQLITCTGDVDSGTPVSSSSTSIVIDLDGGENIICTFNNTKLGTITIVKDAVPNDPQDFSFTCSAPIGSFTLDDDGANGNPLDNFKTTTGLGAGTYTCTETVPGGWDSPPSITCSGETDGGTPASSSSTSVAIDLDPGENITCTFHNNQQVGTITIVKNAVPDDPQDFSFTCSAPIGSFTLDDDGANGNPLSNYRTTTGLSAGTYSCSETAVSGWPLTSATCDDGSPPSAISLQAGESVTCTFTNNGAGNIVVCKQTNPDGDAQSFNFTTSYPPGGFSLSDGQCSNSGNLAPSTYSVSEAVPALWTLTGATCTDGSPPSAISLQAGETVTCTFNNQKYGKIIIVKDAQPNDPNQDFSFDCQPLVGQFTLDDDSDPTFSNTAMFDVPPGTYNCGETVPSGWTLTSAICSDGSSAGAISLQAGETVTCTFVDTPNTAFFNVNKNWLPDDPGGVTITLVCTSGAVTPVDPIATESDDANFTIMGFTTPASCTATEPTSPNYTDNQSDCLNKPITVGGTQSCTMVNTLIKTFTVQKDWVPNDTGVVTIALTCSSGTVTPVDPTSSEGDSATFTVTNFALGTTCTATESGVPATHTANQSGCQAVPLATGVCTMVNTRNDASFLVYKDFTDDNPQDVPVALSCTSGTVVPVDPDASESDPADFAIEGIVVGTTCNATEDAPFPYYQQSSNCTGVLLTIGGTGSCTIVNAIIPPGENPVGGIAGLIEADDAVQTPSAATGTGHGAIAWTLALSAGAAAFVLIVAGLWVTGRVRFRA